MALTPEIESKLKREIKKRKIDTIFVPFGANNLFKTLRKVLLLFPKIITTFCCWFLLEWYPVLFRLRLNLEWLIQKEKNFPFAFHWKKQYTMRFAAKIVLSSCSSDLDVPLSFFKWQFKVTLSLNNALVVFFVDAQSNQNWRMIRTSFKRNHFLHLPFAIGEWTHVNPYSHTHPSAFTHTRTHSYAYARFKQ